MLELIGSLMGPVADGARAIRTTAQIFTSRRRTAETAAAAPAPAAAAPAAAPAPAPAAEPEAETEPAPEAAATAPAPAAEPEAEAAATAPETEPAPEAAAPAPAAEPAPEAAVAQSGNGTPPVSASEQLNEEVYSDTDSIESDKTEGVARDDDNNSDGKKPEKQQQQEQPGCLGSIRSCFKLPNNEVWYMGYALRSALKATMGVVRDLNKGLVPAPNETWGKAAYIFDNLDSAQEAIVSCGGCIGIDKEEFKAKYSFFSKMKLFCENGDPDLPDGPSL